MPQEIPEVLWIHEKAIGLTLEDTYEGEGVKYILADAHYARVNELLKSNNQLLERARVRLKITQLLSHKLQNWPRLYAAALILIAQHAICYMKQKTP